MITTNTLHGSDGGEISASTLGAGAGGSIDISAHFLDLNNFAIRADTSSPDTFALTGDSLATRGFARYR